MIRLICVQTYHGHWAGHSGYHRYIPHLEKRFNLEHQRVHRGKLAPEECGRTERFIFRTIYLLLKKFINPWTTEKDLFGEFKIFQKVKKHLLNGEEVVVHFMDGEVGFNFFGNYKKFLGPESERLRILATYHQPPDYLKKFFPKKKKTEKLDGLLTVGTSQYSYFDFLPKSKILFVPHGVDTEYFHPGDFQEVSDKLYCITVGQWLRDFDALEQIINFSPPNVVFRIIAVKENLERFRAFPNVELYSGIDDEALRRLYQESHIGLMPLLDSTANNALLEMMAIGLPIVVTRVGSVEDYVNDDCCVLLSNNEPEEIIRVLRLLESDSEKRKNLGIAARNKSLEFSWPKTADRMTHIYSSR